MCSVDSVSPASDVTWERCKRNFQQHPECCLSWCTQCEAKLTYSDFMYSTWYFVSFVISALGFIYVWKAFFISVTKLLHKFFFSKFAMHLMKNRKVNNLEYYITTNSILYIGDRISECGGFSDVMLCYCVSGSQHFCRIMSPSASQVISQWRMVSWADLHLKMKVI
jgi:hypothetical protein